MIPQRPELEHEGLDPPVDAVRSRQLRHDYGVRCTLAKPSWPPLGRSHRGGVEDKVLRGPVVRGSGFER